MKKIFGKLKDLISTHKLLAIVCLLAFILFVILVIMALLMTISTTDSYGNRLDGIEEVEITDSSLTEKKEKLEENKEVSKATIRIQGKIVYFTIHYNRGTSIKKAKEIANSTLETFSDEEKSFYDFQYILSEDRADNEEEAKTFTITGTKHSTLKKITWAKN